MESESEVELVPHPISRLNLLSAVKSAPSDIDVTDDDEAERCHLRQSTSLTTKLQRIRDGTTPTMRKKKKYIKNNKSLKDWWMWYFQNPVQNLPFLHFLIILFLTPILSIFWFMDQDSSFIICGVIGLIMTIYAIHKFRILISLKREVNKYRELNIKFKKSNIALQAEIDRVLMAHKELRKTRKRVTRANERNKDNLLAFHQIEIDMKMAGQRQIKGMQTMHKRASEIRDNWRDELISNERDLLHSAFERFETTGDRTDGVTYDEFRKLTKMLPARYRKRFVRTGTFNTFAQGRTVIDFQQFTKAVDLFAQQEVDNIDLDPTPYVTPYQTPLLTPFQSPMYLGHYRDQGSAASFDSLGLNPSSVQSLGLNPSSVQSVQSNISDADTVIINYNIDNNGNRSQVPMLFGSPSLNEEDEINYLLPQKPK